MNDSVDMDAGGDRHADMELSEQLDAAAARLKTGLSQLEKRLTPVLKQASEADSRIADMEMQLAAKVREAEAFVADRAELAARLDAATADAGGARQEIEDKLAEVEREAAEMRQEMEAKLATSERNATERETAYLAITQQMDTQLASLFTQVERALQGQPRSGQT